MMSDFSPFLVLEQPSCDAITWVINKVSTAGMQVVRTFDLRSTRVGPQDCHCTDHESDLCDCQMVVLLIYGGNSSPISLVAQSCDGKTQFSIVDSPQQQVDPHQEKSLLEVLKPAPSPDSIQAQPAHNC